MRIAVLILALSSLAGCAAPGPIASIDGPSCRVGVTKTFWLPCAPDKTWRT